MLVVYILFMCINLYKNLKACHFIDVVNRKFLSKTRLRSLNFSAQVTLDGKSNFYIIFIHGVFLHERIRMHRSGNVSPRYSSWPLQIYQSDGDHANKDCRHRTGHRSVNEFIEAYTYW